MKLRIKSVVVFVFSCFCFVGERSRAQEVIRVDPFEASGSTAGDVFKEVVYIPLETTKESLFGKIDRLVVTDRHFIILDHNTNSILLFLKSGKFHCRINGGSTITNLSNYIHTFSVNREKGEIAFKKGPYIIVYYNFNGKRLREEKTKFIGDDFVYFSGGRIAWYEYNTFKGISDSIGYELQIAGNGKVYANLLRYNRRKAALLSDDIGFPDHSVFYDTGVDSAYLYWRPYDYNIYTLTPSKLSKTYSLLFPLAQSLPADFITDTTLTGKRMRYIENNKEVVFGISHLYRLNNNLFFKLNTYSRALKNNKALMYNLKTGNLIAVSHILPDSTNFFLPIGDTDGFSTEFDADNFHTSDNEYLYASRSSLEMFRARQLTEYKKIIYNEVLTAYFNKESKKSNPVIIRLKPGGE